MGGTDDPSNLVELTPKEHAEAHRLLYEKHGNWQDYVAWKGLLGLLNKTQIIREMYDRRKGENNPMYNKSITDFMTDEEVNEWKRNLSKAGKGRKKTKEHSNKIGLAVSGVKNGMYGKPAWNKGKKGVQPKSLETKKKISIPVTFRGIEYYSMAEAKRQTGLSTWLIKKENSETSK